MIARIEAKQLAFKKELREAEKQTAVVDLAILRLRLLDLEEETARVKDEIDQKVQEINTDYNVGVDNN